MSDEGAPVSIVTGAAGGIGVAIVDAFLREGMAVVAVDLAIEEIEERFEQQIAARRLFPIAADLADLRNWTKIKNFSLETCGRIDILVNNAGQITRQSIKDSEVSDWDRQIDVNLKASYFLSKLCAEEMRKNAWGRIINLSSQAGQTGGAEDCAIYAISKGGIDTMTRSFARAYAKYGVTANAIAPGIVMTDMIKKTLADDRIDAVLSQIPIGRATSTSEIAAAALYLCSEEAGSVTGHVLDINGGLLMR
jgi:3-oxoacyl-[acyl-carrier protein] reductase